MQDHHPLTLSKFLGHIGRSTFAVILTLVLGLESANSKMARFDPDRTGLTYGFIDKNGRYQIEPQFSKASGFNESNTALVEIVANESHARYAAKLCDTRGKCTPNSNFLDVIELPKQSWSLCRWKTASDKNKGQKLRSGYTFCSANGRTMKMDFQKATNFGDGMASVTVGGLTGFLKTDETFQLQPSLKDCSALGESADGLIPVRTTAGCGFMDKLGKWRITPIYKNVQSFKFSLSPVEFQNLKDSSNPMGLITSQGKIFDQHFHTVEEIDGDIVAVSQNSPSPRGASIRWGLLDSHGKWVLKPQFLGIGPLKDGLRFFRDGDSLGFMDKNGKVVISPRFSQAGSFSEGIAPVCLPNSEALVFIDKTGSTIFSRTLKGPVKITSRWPVFNDGLCAMHDGYQQKWGYIDRTNKWKILPQFREAQTFSNGFAVVGVEQKHNCK